MRGELLLNRLADRAQQLAGLGILVGCRAAIGDQPPALGLERDLAALPGAPANLDRRFEQGELVGPRGEAAVAAEVVELGDDGEQGVVGALLREVVEVSTPQVREGGAAASHLEPRGTDQQLAQLTHRLVTLPALAAQPAQPGARLEVGLGRRSHRTQLGTGHVQGALDRDANTPATAADRGGAQHGPAGPSSGATMRTASSAGQPRSTSSSSAWMS
jgi:hypothetical protein